ncbi:MAG: PEP-CTERM sorting domain-containing protein [Phycisphaerae bacterium]|nr:PEP-CTERM sorting domain-containing protein [Phycisphaerae bacterium]
MRAATIGTVCLFIVTLGGPAYAAFIVEPHSTGKASGNFAYQNGSSASFTSTTSGAIGLTATKTAFGGNGTIDRYVSSYTPGVDQDNTVLTPGWDLGNGDLATGLAGGGTGLYNVYWTTPLSTNVSGGGSLFILTSDGMDVALNDINNNTGGTGSPGANGAWLLLAANLHLTEGQTYMVSQLANNASYVSQRNAGIMWERVPDVAAVPEPATMVFLALAGLFCRRRR